MRQVIGLAVGAAVIVGGAYYLLSAKSPETTRTAETTEVSPSEGTTDGTPSARTTGTKAVLGTVQGPSATSGKFDGSVEALIARGGEWKCSIDTSTDKTVSSGQVFVAKGKFRGNFTTNVKGFGDVMSYMISDGVTTYTWSTASPTGIKMPATKGSIPGSGPTTGGGAVDATHSYSYVCEPWSVDMSMFTPPNNVQFMSVPR